MHRVDVFGLFLSGPGGVPRIRPKVEPLLELGVLHPQAPVLLEPMRGSGWLGFGQGIHLALFQLTCALGREAPPKSANKERGFKAFPVSAETV